MTETIKEVVDNKDGKTGIPGTEADAKEPSEKEKFIIIDSKGWVTARIHLSQGLYNIVGFLKETEDNVRYFFVQKKKQDDEEKNKKLIRPGFRGFNPFKKGS